jgi:hypothetical protein
MVRINGVAEAEFNWETEYVDEVEDEVVYIALNVRNKMLNVADWVHVLVWVDVVDNVFWGELDFVMEVVGLLWLLGDWVIVSETDRVDDLDVVCEMIRDEVAEAEGDADSGVVWVIVLV